MDIFIFALDINVITLLQITNICDVHLPETLNSLFPWMEYLLRAGWTPDGK